jgi:hypothetical protein
MEGCNEILYEDPRTYAKMNRAYVAHINAAKEDWSRGKSRLSEEELRSIDNLMLL